MKREAVKNIINNAETPPETIDQAVDRLAKFPPLEYDQCREDEAKRLKVRVTTLDAEVIKKRPTSGNTNKKQMIGPQEAEPWHEEIDGLELFNDLVTVFKQYLALQKYQAEAMALWSVFSYCIDASNIAPKLLVYSPEKRCGKTTLLDVLIGLVWKPLSTSNITPAAIFRTIEAIGGTIVIDEADTFINESPEINGIINSGHRKSAAYVIRLVGDSHEPKHFSTWAPNIIAMIGKPTDTIVDRSILIQMKRKKPDDSVQRFIPHKAEPELKVLASKIARWRDDNFTSLCDADPETPTGMNDRAADNWRPLLAIADLIGGDCSETARLAAMTLAESEQEEGNTSIGVVLLADIKDVFESGRRERISTEDLLFALHAMEDRPWPEWNRGKPINPRQISTKLKPFGVKSKTLRDGHKTYKGYDLKDFEDVFPRYLSDLSVTASQPNEINDFNGNAIRNTGQNVTDKNNQKPAKNLDCHGVTDTEVF
ncbi:MAG: DUF3631 domain-containing protein [Rhodospirillales bacterium]|nr:DUF3631 domain-containing protein [Rhodospirillales bacterium]